MAAHFIAVVGPPCGGKSTIAGQVAALLEAPHLEMDRFRTRLLADSDHRVEHRDLAYRAMHIAAELLASRCRTIVLDATYTAEVCRAELWWTVQHVGGVLSVIECRVSAAGAEDRFHKRGTHPACDLTPQRVRALAASYPYYRRPAAIVTSGGEVGAARLLGEALDKPLDNTDGVAWCASGLPRESTVTTADGDVAAQFAPRGGGVSPWSTVQPRT